MSYCIIKSFLDFAAKLCKRKRQRFLYRWKVSAPPLFVILQFSPILIWMNAVEIKQSKRQKKKPQNSLFTFSTLSVTSPPFYDYLSLSLSLSLSRNGSNLSIRLLEGIKTKRNKGYEFFACDFIIFGKSGLIGFLLREGGVLRIRIVISHPPCTPEFSWLPRSYENRDLSLLFGLFKHQSSPSSKL